MKKWLFTLVVLWVTAPFVGIAEPTHPNEIGLYTEPNGYGATGTTDIGIPVNVYLVLTRPEGDNVPLPGIRGFECQLNFNPFGGIFLLGHVLNGAGAINIGETTRLASDGYLEYVVGFPDIVPTVDEACLLISFTFLNAVPDVINVTLGTISSYSPSIPDQMAFVTPFQTLEVMYSMGGSPDAPVFIFNGEAIPVEKGSYGSVKALYR